MKRFIAHWSIHMNRRKNYSGNAGNSQRTLSQVLLSCSLHLSSQMMTPTQYLTSKHKSQRHTNICNFPANMKKSLNRKYKNSRQKWSDCIRWWSKMSPLMKGEWLLLANTPSQMKNYKNKNSCSAYRLNPTRRNWLKFKKESQIIKNSKLNSNCSMKIYSRKKVSKKSRSRQKSKTKNSKSKNYKLSRLSSTMPGLNKALAKPLEKTSTKSIRSWTRDYMKLSWQFKRRKRTLKSYKNKRPSKTRNWVKFKI